MKLKALVVSHHERFRRDLGKLVEIVDSCVEVIGGGATMNEARDRIDLYQPDLVFVDLGLRSGAGLGLTEQIHQRRPQTAVVVVGNEPSNDYRRLALAAGAVEYVDVLEISTQLPEALRRINRSGPCAEQKSAVAEPATSAIPPSASPANLRSRLRTAPTGPKHGPFTAWQYVHLSLVAVLSLLVLNMWLADGPATRNKFLLVPVLLAITFVEARQFARARRAAESQWRRGYLKGGTLSSM